jgi:transcription initiation factor TFIIIB Brf1 subunit/transcription initiation factor TFIIB
MSKTSYPLKIPVSVKEAARRLAREDGVSRGRKIGVVETAAAFLRKRAGDA